MLARSLLIAGLALAGGGLIWGQLPATGAEGASSGAWRNPADRANVARRPGHREASTVSPSSKRAPAGLSGVSTEGNRGAVQSANPVPRMARVSTGSGELPCRHGQLWREYDISPYTFRVTSTNRPEQAIIDWILGQTGYEAWHSEPVAVLSANRQTLWVYHTPEIQSVVADIVERFVSSEAETHTFSLRVVTLSHPNWRARAQRLLQPVPVRTAGVQAWTLEKEDAAILLAELRRRPDYREHSSPQLLVHNGQSAVVSATRGRDYVRNAVLHLDVWPRFEPETAALDEGFSLEFSPLLSVDGRTVDATIKCNIDQLEKMIPVSLDVPAAVAPPQRTKIEVPQISHFRFHERFRWPAEQVLVVGMGMVAMPVPSDGQSWFDALPLPLPSSPPRADLLVFVESKGRAGEALRITGRGRPEAKRYQGRY